MSTYERTISGGEKLMVAYNEQRPPFIIQLTLEGDGEPTPESLYDALERTTEANPGSSLRMDLDRDEEAWVIGPPPTLTLVDAPEFTASDDTDAPFLRWELSEKTGPTCELLFVRGKEKNYLIFRTAHSVMDGQGTLLWALDFMRCLRGEAPVGHPSTIDVDRLVNSIDAKARPLPMPDAIHPFGTADTTTEGDFHWRRISVDRPLDSQATGRIAVAIGELARSIQDGIVRINLPTDLRHYCADERSTANLFNALFLEVGPNASPDTVGLTIVRMLYKHQGGSGIGLYAADVPGPLSVHRVKVMRDLARMHDAGVYPFSATLSHLGVLRSEPLSTPTWTTTSAVFVPLVGDSGCTVSVNGVDEHTEVLVGLSDRFMGAGQLDRLVEVMTTAVS